MWHMKSQEESRAFGSLESHRLLGNFGKAVPIIRGSVEGDNRDRSLAFEE
jgi:hypothetical protein